MNENEGMGDYVDSESDSDGTNRDDEAVYGTDRDDEAIYGNITVGGFPCYSFYCTVISFFQG